MKKYLSIAAASLLAATFFTGCGSDSNNTSSANTGYIVDAAVANIDYTCGNITGVTGSNGEFKYNTGDECTFTVGKVVIGKAKPEAGVKGEGIVTPMDLAGINDVNDPKVVEISRFILSLDDDGNPNNGITVDDTVKQNLSKLETTVELTAEDVTPETIVADLQAAGVTDLSVADLATEEEAISHLANIDTAIEEVKTIVETPAESTTDTTADTTTGTTNCLPGATCEEPTVDTTATDTTTSNTPVLPGMDTTATDTAADTTATDTTATDTTNTTADTTTGTSVVLPGM